MDEPPNRNIVATAVAAATITYVTVGFLSDVCVCVSMLSIMNELDEHGRYHPRELRVVGFIRENTEGALFEQGPPLHTRLRGRHGS